MKCENYIHVMYVNICKHIRICRMLNLNKYSIFLYEIVSYLKFKLVFLNPSARDNGELRSQAIVHRTSGFGSQV